MESVQIGRYDRVFDVYADADDCMTRASLSAYIQALAEACGAGQDSPGVALWEEEADKQWGAIAAVADSDGDGRITRSEWRAVAETLSNQVKEMLAQGGPTPIDVVAQAMYGVMDADCDGRITRDE